MKTDAKSTLQQAFQQLEVFSIPGVGTFRRTYFPAHIDREKNIIRPPGERFILEQGERYVDRLEKFITGTLARGGEAGEKVVAGVADIRSWLVRELKKGGKLMFPGVGSLELSQEKEVKFIAADDQESQRGNFFGLQPLAFTLHAPGAGDGSSKDEKKTEKEEIKEKPAAKPVVPVAPVETSGKPDLVKTKDKPAGSEKAKEKPAEPVAVVPPPVAGDPGFVEPEEPKKKRSKAWIWIILILLLLGAGTTGVIMREQVREQLVSWGWISDGESTDGDGTEVVDGTGGEDGTLMDGDIAGDDGSDGDGTDGDGTGDDGNDDWRDVEINDADGTEKVGTFAEPGVYYLIVASVKEPANAKVIRSQMGGKVMRPRYEGNYHRIYTYKSTDKDQVIAKMVESKEKYPQSWIYWMGM